MAISIFSSTTSAQAATTTHTIPSNITTNTNRYCLVLVADCYGGLPSGVTCGGNTMTIIRERDEGGAFCGAYGFTASGHSTGTQNIVVSYAVATRAVILVLSLKNVHQTTPIRGFSHDFGSAGNPSDTISSATDDWVFDCLSWYGDSAAITMTVGAGQTQLANYNYPANVQAGAFSYEAGAASTVMSWTRVPSWVDDIWNLLTISVTPSDTEAPDGPTAPTVNALFFAGD